MVIARLPCGRWVQESEDAPSRPTDWETATEETG